MLLKTYLLDWRCTAARPGGEVNPIVELIGVADAESMEEDSRPDLDDVEEHLGRYCCCGSDHDWRSSTGLAGPGVDLSGHRGLLGLSQSTGSFRKASSGNDTASIHLLRGTKATSE
jgi:hypothetical protein